MTHYGSCGRAYMTVRIRITSQCPANMHGPSCATECEEVPEQRTCNYLGEATCLGNFEEPDCDDCSMGFQGTACDTCAPNYHPMGSCTTYCEPMDNDQGHYTCDSSGKKVCFANYYRDEVCTKFCEPRDNAQGHYSCNPLGNIECLPGYIDSSTNCVTCSGNFKEPDCNNCDDHYYPQGTCDTFCEPRDDEGGHYICTSLGEIVCLAGYTDPSTNCITCEGNFKEPDCDECDVHFEGDDCDTCEPNYYPRNSCSVMCIPRNNSEGHYTCDSVTGDKICLEGYKDPSTNCVTRVESGFVGSIGFYATIGASVLCTGILVIAVVCIVKCRRRPTLSSAAESKPTNQSTAPMATSFPMATMPANHPMIAKQPMEFPPPYSETETQPSAPPFLY